MYVGLANNIVQKVLDISYAGTNTHKVKIQEKNFKVMFLNLSSYFMIILQASDCLPCTGGEFCGDYNMTVTSGNCTAGYYCPVGETAPTTYECTVGHYCPEGTTAPVLCPSGFYQDEVRKWTCKLCPAGYYCDSSYGVVVINNTITCPVGHYCPQGGSTYLYNIIIITIIECVFLTRTFTGVVTLLAVVKSKSIYYLVAQRSEFVDAFGSLRNSNK
jgi:hypothetical protein